MHRFAVALSCLALPVMAAGDPADSPIDLDVARQQFAAAQAICGADGGRFWGVHLCGPIIFVDQQTRQVVANQQDTAGSLREHDGVFTGSLPLSQNVASTPTHWSGVLWTQITWPLPQDASRRDTLLAHELFHRIQDQIAIPLQHESANGHLDTLDGRYLMQLEWRALVAALRSTAQPARRQAVVDALTFRAARYELFPSAAREEKSLELNEGIAEYTGVSVGNRTRKARVAMTLWDLDAHSGDETLVRSFAYATGPAYGLLLDTYSPGWRQQLRTAPSLNDLLQAATHVALAQNIGAAAAERAQRYDDGGELHRAEVTRETRRQQALAMNRAKFVDGPVLVMPVDHANIEFNPRNLRPLDQLGTVYPTLRISAAWGVLDAHDGALLAPDWSTVTVEAPAAGAVQGPGWSLALKPDWQIVPGRRSGDFTLAGPQR